MTYIPALLAADCVMIKTINFCSKNVKFWLYNLQILTLFRPINFLCMQLQNNSSLGVEVNPEVIHALLSFKIKKNLVV